MRRLIAAAIVTGSLGFLAQPAGACSTCWAKPPRPTIENGGLPYGHYYKEVNGVLYRCDQYRGKADDCYPIRSNNFGWIIWGGLS